MTNAWMKDWLCDPDVLESVRHDVSGLRGTPEVVARPREIDEVVQIVHYCAERRLAVTPIAGRTSTTGAPLAPRGLALDMRGITGIGTVVETADGATLTVAPGTILADAKAAAAAAGWEYPPDPTSTPDCTVGGTLATNASGPRGFAFGATRDWVHALTLVDGRGKLHEFARRQTTKASTGYAPLASPLDLVVGSEGTLGVIVSVTLRLRRAPAALTGLWAFFPELADACALAASPAIRTGVFAARCAEGFDAAALELIRERHARAACSAMARAALYLEIEHGPDERDAVLSAWEQRLAAAGAMVDDTVVMTSANQFSEFGALRRAIPDAMNAAGRRAAAQGGFKHSTDWCVPPSRLAVMFTRVDERLRAAGLDDVFHIRFGHFGDGHPHHNWITTDAATDRRLRRLLPDLYAEATSLGGVIAAEHGIGKLKAKYLRRALDPVMLKAGRALKCAFDPLGIMAPGNIFG